ncbi:MAG: DNA recombination/repair protein RecA, partial [bacterium]
MNEEKRKDLESAMSQIERQFGKGSIMKLGDQALNQVSVIGSGNLGLDIAL